MERRLLVADDIATAALGVLVGLGPRTIALSGGSTPRPLYEALARQPYPWEEVDVFFGDERCVPPDHPDSNFGMAREALLAMVAAHAHPMPGETCDAEAYERTLRERFGDEVPSLDLVLLGLGEDGHTASLFPGDPALDERERWVVRVERPDHPRLTLTLPVLGGARAAMFLVEGEAKREPLRRLLDGDPSIPAARVEADRVLVVADRAAAG
ncbi:MAG TPA: 6-phosphogluconolactonase [Actinomycetota bacterium]|nr:6-phosphogluconolactonase [Actinomycetota bacterium]